MQQLFTDLPSNHLGEKRRNCVANLSADDAVLAVNLDIVGEGLQST